MWIVQSKEEVVGQLTQIYFSSEAKREYILVFPPDYVIEDSTGFDLPPSKQWLKGNSSAAERVRKQLVVMMSRKFKIDQLVAEAYLAVAEWDPFQAMEQYSPSQILVPD